MLTTAMASFSSEARRAWRAGDEEDAREIVRKTKNRQPRVVSEEVDVPKPIGKRAMAARVGFVDHVYEHVSVLVARRSAGEHEETRGFDIVV